MDVRLNLVNASSDTDHPRIVIFQRNPAAVDNLAIAWRVIPMPPPNVSFPFAYPLEIALAASDAWGNVTPPVTVSDGQLYGMVRTPSGDALQYLGAAASREQVQCRNDLTQGAISANLYRDGKLLMSKTAIVPGQTAAFTVVPEIFVGAVASVEEGQVINDAVLSTIDTRFPLLGIVSADIVITGGGSGPEAPPLVFSLENVVRM